MIGKWGLIYGGLTVAAIALNVFLARKHKACTDNAAFACALLAGYALTYTSYAYPALGAASDLIDSLIGAIAAIMWLYRRQPLWDWRLALALIHLFMMGFHAAFRAGLYVTHEQLYGYQIRLNILYAAAVLTTAAGPLKIVVGWIGDRWFPVPTADHRSGPAPASRKAGTWL